MRTFLVLYSSDYIDDDDRYLLKSGKTSNAERQAFTLLSSVCLCWWRSLAGWPESSTSQWVRHKMRQLIKRKYTCT